jgi:hypothetical protein
LEVEILLAKAKRGRKSGDGVWTPDAERTRDLELGPLKPEAGDGEIRTLLKQRYNAAARECALLAERRELDEKQDDPARGLLAAHARRAAVAFDLFPNDVRRLEEIAAQARKLEMTIREQSKAGLDLLCHAENAQGYRLDIEILVARARQAVKPAGMPDKAR